MAGVIAAHEEDEDEGHDHPGDDTNDGDDGAHVHSVFHFLYHAHGANNGIPCVLVQYRVSREP